MSGEATDILIVSERGDDVTRITHLLEESSLPVRCQRCDGPDQLAALDIHGGIDLILYRPPPSSAADQAVARFLERYEPRPGLLLLVNGVVPDHYVRAGRLAADDVIDLELPAQLDFVVRREIKHGRLRHQYAMARRKLDEERVIDDAEFAEPEAGAHVPELVETIDQAIAHDRMELLFQPILATRDDGYENHEVFLRIRGDDGYLMPDEFLPTAHRYGLMTSIDRWVVNKTIEHFHRNQEELEARKGGQSALRFFVNLSSHSLVDTVAIREILQSIARAKLPPGAFVIEVGKDTILSRLKRSKSVNQKVKQLRLQFAMDQYETDDNALNYGKHLALDFIKIKRSLVKDIDRAPQRCNQIREIVDSAHAAGIRVIASQVERAAELALMYELGVDCFQGYVIAEPASKPVHGIGLDEVAF